jgi:transposase
MTTTETLVPHRRWQAVEPLLPPPPPRYGGLPRIDDRACLAGIRRRGITSRIARRGIESSGKLGRHRYVVERSLAWLVGYRRLQVRYERRADILTALLQLACALSCLNSLQQSKA